MFNNHTPLNNKYTNWYFNIINSAKTSDRRKGEGVYYEEHHITPKSLNGSNNKDNLVLLTAKEHYLCHALLIKMFNNNNIIIKMSLAFNRLNSSGIKKTNSILYQQAKMKISENMKINNPMYYLKEEQHFSTKTILIYNEQDNMIYKSKGNFNKFCKIHSLPYSQLMNSYKNNKPIYKNGYNQKKQIPNKYKKYIGWYAIIEGTEKVIWTKEMLNYTKPLNRGSSKIINIFNKDDELMYKCDGNFSITCKKYHLPSKFNSLKSKERYKVTQRSPKHVLKYEGWYVVK